VVVRALSKDEEKIRSMKFQNPKGGKIGIQEKARLDEKRVRGKNRGWVKISHWGGQRIVEEIRIG